MAVPGSRLAELRWKNVESIQAEIAQEKAGALARTAERLEEALARLAVFDAGDSQTRDTSREELVAAASQALWYYVVQREACGLRDVDMVLRELRVPREVYLRMGYVPSRAPRG
jgi:hypothetical protein